MLLLLAACSGVAAAKTEATAFENSRTGQMTAACGPRQGFKGALDKARHGCDQDWPAKGWVPLNQSVADLAE